jgi:hypothetical protein|tara:strand:+ start:26148 stop:26432 length:285 start_codon:yes stop_codon:yes gene_type:complete
MSKEIGESTKVTLDLKTLGIIIGGVVSLSSMYFVLQADIAEAKKLPEPTIQRIEFDMKDEAIREAIMDTQKDVEMLLRKFDKMEERVYEISKKP